jgi:hypothetical protein
MSTKDCFNFLRTGNCSRGSNCKFSHSKAKGTGSDQCLISHEDSRSALSEGSKYLLNSEQLRLDRNIDHGGGGLRSVRSRHGPQMNEARIDDPVSPLNFDGSLGEGKL